MRSALIRPFLERVNEFDRWDAPLRSGTTKHLDDEVGVASVAA
jgi:hypothetical protein